ncbi:unnamed protein product [Musa textilis]
MGENRCLQSLDVDRVPNSRSFGVHGFPFLSFLRFRRVKIMESGNLVVLACPPWQRDKEK